MRRLGYALSALALCSLALGPGFAFAAENADLPASKDETVRIYADANGAARETKVTVTLENPDELQTLSDETTLSGIEADDPDQNFAQDGDELIWNARSENVIYTGVADRPAPVTLSVSYELDGTQVQPQDIAGESGHVTIRYDYRNDSAVSALGTTIYTPFTAITALMFDGDSFDNVKVTNGKVVNDGDDVIVIGYAAPGLKESLGSIAEDVDVPDHLIIEADAVDFSMKSSLTMITAGLMEDIDLDDADTAELSDTSNGLAEATSALVEGTGELASGLGELADGSSGLSDAAWRLNSGARSASDSIPELVAGIDRLDDGAHALADGAAQLDGGVSTLGQSIAQAREVCDQASAVLAAMGATIETVKSNNAGAEAIVASAVQNEEVPAAVRSELESALASLKANDVYLAGLSSQDSAESAVQRLASAVAQLGAGLGPEATGALVTGAAQVKEGASQLAAGLDALSEGTSPLVSGVNQLVSGTSQLATGADQLASGAKAAAEGSDALAEGMRAYSDEAISEIIGVIDDKVINLVDRIDALKRAAADYDSFSGKAPDTPGTVRFVVEVDGV